MELPFVCGYYDNPEDKDKDYYKTTKIHESVADSMIEASRFLDFVNQDENLNITARIIEIKTEDDLFL